MLFDHGYLCAQRLMVSHYKRAQRLEPGFVGVSLYVHRYIYHQVSQVVLASLYYSHFPKSQGFGRFLPHLIDLALAASNAFTFYQNPGYDHGHCVSAECWHLQVPLFGRRLSPAPMGVRCR